MVSADVIISIYLNKPRGRGLLRWSVIDSYLLALARLHNHPGHTSNNNRRDIDPLPGHVFFPLRGSSNSQTSQLSNKAKQSSIFHLEVIYSEQLASSLALHPSSE
ncbi:hypothetical protein PAMP_013843 [Pampus punctatissimus]